MKHRVEHDLFTTNTLEVAANGLTGTKVFLNGERVKPKKRVFQLTDDTGAPATLKLKPAFPDVIPKVIVNGGFPIALVDPLPWYAYVLAIPPMTLIFAGGALGGAMGAAGSVAILSFFRTDYPIAAKVAGSFGISALAWIAFGIVATLLHLLING